MIGRSSERKILDKLVANDSSELLGVIGRRRVGKTYLIREHYKNHIVFDFTGTQHASKKNQLRKFAIKLEEVNPKGIKIAIPKDWAEAFQYLTLYLKGLRKSKRKKVVFFDELPWLASHRSGFLNEFSYWWNDWATQQSIVVVICGSAASWMIDKVVRNKGGLHNRVTQLIHLQPFTLAETRKYVHSINPAIDDYSILQLYMSLGGIPYYLKQLSKGESVTQSIQRLCFDKDGMLRYEFGNLYAALYDGHEKHVEVVRALSAKWKGLTRQEIIQSTNLADGGGITKVLIELEAASFIKSMLPFGKKKKDTLFRLVDEYSLFYLHFIEDQRAGKKNVWLQSSSDHKYNIWRGYAFENLCIKHSDAILRALKIQGVSAQVSSYLHLGNEYTAGVQIDMLIDRADRTINLCEMKFYNDEILVTQEFIRKIRNRRTKFIELSKIKKTVYNTLITTYGLRGKWQNSSEIDQVITLSDLFLVDSF